MITATFYVTRREVLDEIQQTTNYTGAKMDNPDESVVWERIRTIDADEGQLLRFWDESTVAFSEVMKQFIDSEPVTTDEGTAFAMSFSSAFDQSLLEPMRKELFSFYVTNIISKWFAFTNKPEAADYGQFASGLLEGIHRKACWKKKPTRPTYN